MGKPHVRVEFDAITKAQAVAGALGIPVRHAVGSLTLLWHWCRVEMRDVVDHNHLQGFFGLDGKEVAAALEAFGFIERIDGGFRVKAAARLLGVRTKQRESGLAHAGNLRRGPGKNSPGLARVSSGSRPDLHLTSNIQHPASYKEEVAPKPPAPPVQEEFEVAKESLLHRMISRWVIVRHCPYVPAWEKDGAQLKRVRKEFDDELIGQIWEAALARDDWLRATGVAHFCSQFNAHLDDFRKTHR